MKRGRLTAQKERRLAYLRSKRKGGQLFSKNQVKKLKSIANAEELKFHDTDVGVNLNSSNITIDDSIVAGLAQGDNDNDRDGNKVTVKSVYINGSIRIEQQVSASVNVPTSVVVDTYLILDKQCNGAAPNVTDIFTANDYNAFMNLDNKERFSILKKKRTTLTVGLNHDGTNYFSNEHYKAFEIYKGNLSLPIMYDDTAGNLSGIRSNNLFLVHKVTDQGAAIISANSRVRYLG